MENNTESTKEQNRIREMLKKLPKVQTSPDFEAQLQRRIGTGKEKEIGIGFIEKFFHAPAFSYSLAALLILCGLSAYIIYRTRTFEYADQRQIPSISPSPSVENTPLLKMTESTTTSKPSLQSIRRSEKQSIQSTEQTNGKTTREIERGSAGAGAAIEQDIRSKEAQKVNEVAVPTNTLEAQTGHARSLPAGKGAEQSTVESKNNAPSPDTVKSEHIRVSPAIQTEMRMEAVSADQDSIGMKPSITPKVMFQTTSPLKVSSINILNRAKKDSVSRADSLRLDSLSKKHKRLDSIRFK